MKADDPTKIDRTSAIGHDVPCGACGYNLRGLNVEAVCPECGVPIQWSLTIGPMIVWRRRFRRGVIALACAMVVLLIFPSGFFYTDLGRRVFHGLVHSPVNVEGTEMVLEAVDLSPAALWLTRLRSPKGPKVRGAMTLYSIAALLLLGVNNLCTYNMYSFVGVTLLLCGYALGPIVYAICIFLILGPIVDSTDVLKHSLPRWVVQAVRCLLLYAMLSPALMDAVINFARIKYYGQASPSGHWVDPRLGAWMQTWVFTPGNRIFMPVWLATMLIVAHSFYRSLGHAFTPVALASLKTGPV